MSGERMFGLALLGFTLLPGIAMGMGKGADWIFAHLRPNRLKVNSGTERHGFPRGESPESKRLMVMAFQRGRQAAEETAKAECLRRWPTLDLRCEARYYEGRCEGFVVTEHTDRRRDIWDANGRSASEAWRGCLAVLETRESE